MAPGRLSGLLAAFLLLLAAEAQAARVDTLAVPSAAMGRAVQVVVAVPEGEGPFPTVYLLHGHGGDAKNWARRLDPLGGLGAYADRFGVVLVCPDGTPDAWYFDSPRDPTVRMETFVATELPAYVEAHLPVVADRAWRAITGLSMGGHGALYLALRHPERYAAAASMSGGVDLAAFPDRWGKARHLGPYEADTAAWHARSVVHLAARADTTSLPTLLVDCGVQDFFLDANRRLHAVLLARSIPHDYVERPGGHTWAYWTRVLPYHLAFFRDVIEETE